MSFDRQIRAGEVAGFVDKNLYPVLTTFVWRDGPVAGGMFASDMARFMPPEAGSAWRLLVRCDSATWGRPDVLVPDQVRGAMNAVSLAIARAKTAAKPALGVPR